MLVITLRAAIYNFAGRDLMPYLGHITRSGRCVTAFLPCAVCYFSIIFTNCCKKTP